MLQAAAASLFARMPLVGSYGLPVLLWSAYQHIAG
jgi:hypothetical protein